MIREDRVTLTREKYTPGSLWVVIPAYNEAGCIGSVVKSLRCRGYQVVVVDDDSRDFTAEQARGNGATVLRHYLNLGQGGALQTGISYCLESGAQFICTFDADGQHCPEDIQPMWDCLLLGDFDIVLGSRFLGRAPGISIQRRFLLKAAILFTRLHSGLQLTDAHNGLRVMRAGAAAKLAFRQLGMAHASEIIDEIARLKLSYSEFPVTIKYTDYSRTKGQSGLGSIRIVMDLLISRLVR